MSLPTKNIRSPTVIASRLTITGLVQGIGMRPAIARFAERLFLNGYVKNTITGVEIHVEGEAECVERFEQELRSHLPTQAQITSIQPNRVPVEGSVSFVSVSFAVPSSSGTRHRKPVLQTNVKLSACVPADVVVCDDCLAEIQNPNDRRYNYPFTSCTNCGPRYSIIERMPYERADTSMNAFPMCAECQRENETSSNRRFHSQTNSCPNCGPQIWLCDSAGKIVARHHEAILAAAIALFNDGVVALRGLGGYQLLVVATSQVAVERLRERKYRQGKPLAVMVASLSEADSFALLDKTEKELLTSPAGPIIIAHLNTHSTLAIAVTSGLNTVGLMLPTTPLHWLLAKSVNKPLVCTSANIDGEPLVYETESAFEKLSGIADVWLEHDRPIQRPIDDSVMRVMAGRPAAIRLGRGYAPLSLSVATDDSIIALGGHQKCSLAIGNSAQAFLGPHIGDMNTVAARQRFTEQASELSELYGTERSHFVCDLHPEYFTAQWAHQQVNPVTKAQHHHAHIVAGTLEHGWREGEVLGVAFDGTGYGTEKTIWGGEFLQATVAGFKRVGHLRPFPLVGGETAIRQPWRVAFALVRDALGDADALQLKFDSDDAGRILPLLDRPNLAPMTTSAGRLFDGIAALLLGVEHCQFEGQPAMLLESACDLTAEDQYEFTIQNTEPKQLDWRPLVRQLMLDRANGVSSGAMAMRFHRAVANAICDFCSQYSPLPVVLGGGVFQNRVLVELLADRFSNRSDGTYQTLGLPGMIPVNDGGLAAGQLAIAVAHNQQRRNGKCV